MASCIQLLGGRRMPHSPVIDGFNSWTAPQIIWRSSEHGTFPADRYTLSTDLQHLQTLPLPSREVVRKYKQSLIGKGTTWSLGLLQLYKPNNKLQPLKDEYHICTSPIGVPAWTTMNDQNSSYTKKDTGLRGEVVMWNKSLVGLGIGVAKGGGVVIFLSYTCNNPPKIPVLMYNSKK